MYRPMYIYIYVHYINICMYVCRPMYVYSAGLDKSVVRMPGTTRK